MQKLKAKRYKLDVRLPLEVTEAAGEQVAEKEPENAEAVISTDKAEETLPEPVSEDKEPEKSKRTRKASTREKKTTSRRKKKEIQEEEQA